MRPVMRVCNRTVVSEGRMHCTTPSNCEPVIWVICSRVSKVFVSLLFSPKYPPLHVPFNHWLSWLKPGNTRSIQTRSFVTSIYLFIICTVELYGRGWAEQQFKTKKQPGKKENTDGDSLCITQVGNKKRPSRLPGKVLPLKHVVLRNLACPFFVAAAIRHFRCIGFYIRCIVTGSSNNFFYLFRVDLRLIVFHQ